MECEIVELNYIVETSELLHDTYRHHLNRNLVKRVEK